MSVDTVSISETPTRFGRKFTSVHFQERARHYRYAAALTDNPQNIQQFLGLAAAFDFATRKRRGLVYFPKAK